MTFSKSIFVLLLLYFALDGNSQSTAEEDTVYTQAEVMPEFPGGKEKLIVYVVQNLEMPLDCPKEKISTKLFIEFIVNENGKVINPSLKSTSGCAVMDRDIIQIFTEMPDWTPGRQNDKPVHVKMIYPLIIELR